MSCLLEFSEVESAKQSIKTLVAIRFVTLLFKSTLVQLFQAKTANKVFWMKFSEHGSNATTRYRLMAAGAKGAPERVIMGLAVRVAFVLEKCAIMERRVALFAHEAIWVPLLVQRGNVVFCDGRITAATSRCKLIEITGLAIGRVSSLMEAFFT